MPYIHKPKILHANSAQRTRNILRITRKKQSLNLTIKTATNTYFHLQLQDTLEDQN
jgi:hypothetical protein